MIDPAKGNYIEYASPNTQRVLGLPPSQVLEHLHSLKADGSAEEEMGFSGLQGLKPGESKEALNTQ